MTGPVTGTLPWSRPTSVLWVFVLVAVATLALGVVVCVREVLARRSARR